MNVRSIIESQLKEAFRNEPQSKLPEENYLLIEELLQKAVEIFGDNPNISDRSTLQSVFENYIDPSVDESWGLKGVFEALSSESPIESYQKYIVKRLFDAIRRESNSIRNCNYYEIVHAIYRNDFLLKKLWLRYLCPIPLLDVDETPKKKTIDTIITSEAGTREYFEIIKEFQFEKMSLEGINNAARWIVILASNLNLEDQKDFIDNVPQISKGESANEILYLKVLKAIFSQIKLLQPVISEIVTYQVVVTACILNDSWPELDIYLRTESFTYIDEAPLQSIPFDEISPIEVVATPTSPALSDNDPSPSFSEYPSPTESEKRIMIKATEKQLKMSMGNSEDSDTEEDARSDFADHDIEDN